MLLMYQLCEGQMVSKVLCNPSQSLSWYGNSDFLKWLLITACDISKKWAAQNISCFLLEVLKLSILYNKAETISFKLTQGNLPGTDLCNC